MITINEIRKDFNLYKDKEIEISGWIRNIRAQKSFGFINLADGSNLEQIQIVFDDKLKNFNEVSALLVGSSIIVKGKLVLTPDRKQAYEMQAKVIKVCNVASPDFPIQAKRHTRDFLRTKPDLRIRTNLFQAVFRTRSVMAFAVHEFFNKKNFVYTNTPIITSNDGEGAGEMFNVTTRSDAKYDEDFFKKQVYLTVTGQLHGEAYAQGFRSIYTFGPTFRAEKSNTPKHAAEFWMIEPEMAFCDLKQNMDIAEEMVKYLIATAFEKLPQELELFNQFVEPGLIERLKNVLNNPFVRVTHKEAIEILIKANKTEKFENTPKQGEDLATEHEKYLTDKFYKVPVFITDWPKDIKAFYMRLNDDKKTVAAMDLLVSKSGELIGGSQREERPELLDKRIKELKMNPKPIQWYLDLRRFGGTTSSGFGMGFERLIMFITGIDNIRDVIPFPRTVGHCEY